MNNQVTNFSSQAIVLMLIVLVALISGVHSSIVLYKLRDAETSLNKDIQSLLATFNVLAGLVSIGVVIVIFQLNTGSVIKQAGELLTQLNK